MMERGWRGVMGGALIVAAAISGCAAPTSASPERKGSTSSRLGAPKAAVVTPASQETKAQFGIVEWKIFRSKKDLFMTGYDKKGQPVKGLTAGFAQSADDGEDVVHTKINDGSGFAAVRGLSSNRNLASGELDAEGARFMKAAFVDASKANLAFRTAAAGGDAACGEDVSAIVTQALACTQSKGTSKAAQAACVAAAKKASASSAACNGAAEATPGETFDPDAPAFTPGAEGFDPSMFGASLDPAALLAMVGKLGSLGGDPFGAGAMGEVCADGATGEVDWGSGGLGGLAGYDMRGLADFVGGFLGGAGGWGGEMAATEMGGGADDYCGFDLGGFGFGDWSGGAGW